MKTSTFLKEYTADNKMTLGYVLGEIGEFLGEVLRWNFPEMKKEWHDVMITTQLWLYSKFKIDGEMWKVAQPSVDKVVKRKAVWQDLYEFAGLQRGISNYCGNHDRLEKVLKHLESFGISEKKALEAFEKIVLKK